MQTQEWCAAVGAAHAAGHLTRAARDVLFKLARLRSRYRTLYPSHEWLADRVQCCRKTVGRALAQARAIGLISWGMQRWLNAQGWRRGTNIYRLQMPPPGTTPPMGHSVPQEKQSQEEEAQGEVVMAIVEANSDRGVPAGTDRGVYGASCRHTQSNFMSIDRVAAIKALELVRLRRAIALKLVLG